MQLLRMCSTSVQSICQAATRFCSSRNTRPCRDLCVSICSAIERPRQPRRRRVAHRISISHRRDMERPEHHEQPLEQHFLLPQYPRARAHQPAGDQGPPNGLARPATSASRRANRQPVQPPSTTRSKAFSRIWGWRKFSHAALKPRYVVTSCESGSARHAAASDQLESPI